MIPHKIVTLQLQGVGSEANTNFAMHSQILRCIEMPANFCAFLFAFKLQKQFGILSEFKSTRPAKSDVLKSLYFFSY
jgi:hypothetical protein